MTKPRSTISRAARQLGPLRVTTPSEFEIRFVRSFDAPRTLVFDAWTRPEHVRHWWDPTGAELAVCEIDLRPGGSFRWVNQGESGASHPFVGTYREIAPPHKLVFAVPAGPADSIATLLLEEVEGVTVLDMTMRCGSGTERDALLDRQVDIGTAKTLENLARYIGQHGAMRPAAFPNVPEAGR